jgi:hypothetical protein
LSPFEARLDFPSQPDWLGILITLPHNESKRSGFKPIKLLRCFVFSSFIIEQNELLVIIWMNLYSQQAFSEPISMTYGGLVSLLKLND